MFDLNKFESLVESNRLEAKRATGGFPNSVWETYSSFANTKGGVILLGVEEFEDKSLHVVGIKNPDNLMKDFWNNVNNRQKTSTNILTDKNVYSLTIDGKTIVVIDIPRAERHFRPVYINNDLFGGTYRRDGEGDYHCTEEEIKNMLRDQADVTQDTKILPNVGIDAFNADTIKRYRNRFKNFKPNHVWNNIDDHDYFLKIGAAKKGDDGVLHPTGAGLLMFGNEYSILEEYPNYFLDYREKMDETNRWSDRVTSSSGDWSGNIFDFYFKVIDRLTDGIKVPFRLDKGLDRIDDTDVHEAMREALANALIHANYHDRRGIVVEKFKKQVNISNPGDFRINIDEALSGGVSDPRNAGIIKMFALVNIGERAGSGLYNISEVWKRQNWKALKIEEQFGPDRTALTLQIEMKDFPNGEINGEINGGINDRINDRINGGIKSDEKMVLAHISNNNKITSADISKQTAFSTRKVDRIIKTLKENKIIVRVGSNKAGYWEINN